MNDYPDTERESIDSKHLKFLETLIDKATKRLEDDSFEPKMQDALKAIKLKQQVVKTTDAEKIFWDGIETLRQEELPKLYPEEPVSLESQIQSIILSLKDQVKNGLLLVKVITDTFNQDKSQEGRLTYRRIGQLLSTMGFRKARSHAGSYAIIWDDQILARKSFPDVVEDEKQSSASLACPASPACPPSPAVILPTPHVRGWGSS